MAKIDKTVVIPDLHGQVHYLEAIDDQYAGINPNFVIAGDIVNGPNVPESIELAKRMRAKLVMGNHEWVMLAAMFEQDETSRYEWCEQRWRRYGTAMLSSYGIEHPPTPRSVRLLRNKMEKQKHLDFIYNAPLFYEGESPNGRFVVTHAGLTGTNWVQQRIQLKMAKQDQLDGNYGNVDHPIVQLFGSMLIHQAAQSQDKPGRPISVRGHYHSTNEDNRVMSGGKVITLSGESTELNKRASKKSPVYVYESWTGEVKPIYAA